MRKLLLILCLIPLNSFAVEIAKVQSDPGSASRQTFIVTKKSFTYKKESNLFDSKKDYRLGTFLSTHSKDAAEAERKLEGILDQVKKADLVLREKGISFNELSKSRDHHSEFIMLNEFKILRDSNYYGNLDKIFSELSAKPMTLKDGVEVSSDLKKISYFTNSKKTKEEDFNLKFVCKSETLPTICRIKKEGYLFLSK